MRDLTLPTVLTTLVAITSMCSSTAMAADQHETIAKLNRAANYEAAARKCEKFQAVQPGSDDRLREACAEAEWDYARRQNTLTSWSNFRRRWVGTSFEPKALEQEGQKALISLGIQGTEEEFDLLAAKYAGTAAGETAKSKAAFAAFRSVSNVDDAVRVVAKYPKHNEAANITMKYLAGFVSIAFTDGKFNIELDESAVVGDGQTISSNWVSRHPGSRIISWADDARQQLLDAGLSDDFVAQIPIQSDPEAPALPLCFNPNAPDGWEAGVMVRLGRGSAFVAAPWDERCSDKTWPIFLTVSGEQPTGLSLYPGHLISMPTEVGPSKSFAWGEGSSPTRMFVPFAPGTPIMFNNMVAQPLGSTVYLVQPLSGGMPWWWLTSKTPPGNVLKLDATLASSKLYGDWKVASNGPGSVVTSAALDGTTWALPKGEARALSPLVQHVTGLQYSAPEAGVSPLADPKKVTWKLPPRPVRGEEIEETAKPADPAAIPETYGPLGATPSTMEPLTPEDLEAMVGPLTRAGLTVEPLRGWNLSLDDDGAAEVLIEAIADGMGVRFLLDRPEKGITRVFAFDTGVEASIRSNVSAPFSFVVNNTTYLAIAAPLGSGATVTAYHFGALSLERERVQIDTWSTP